MGKKRKKMTAKQLARTRSKASKRGWATRRKNKVINLAISAINKLTPKEAKAMLGLREKGKVSPKQVLQSLERTNIEELLEIDKWVPYHDPEYLHADGTIAIQPTLLRHMGPVTRRIRRTLKKAKKISESFFERTILELADAFGVSEREMYTLWYSP